MAEIIQCSMKYDIKSIKRDKSWNAIDEFNPWQPWFTLNDSIKSSTFISLTKQKLTEQKNVAKQREQN